MIEIYYVLIYFFIFCFGAILGSFLNVLILRIHSDEQWWSGRSYCPNCKKELQWNELIPIISIFLLRGKCSKCGEKISWQYPLVEFISALIAVFCFWKFGLSLEFFLIYLVSWLLLGSFVSDLKFMELPEIFSWSVIILGIIYQIFIARMDFLGILIGVLFGFLFFWLQYFFTKGKGLGEGDIRLGIMFGVFFGWPMAAYGILTSYIFATITLLPLIIVKKVGRKSMIPLGVFLIPVFLLFLYYYSDLENFISSNFYRFI